MRGRLERARIGAAEIETAMTELLELGYLDDERFARLFVQDKRELDGWGQDRIGRALRERGVDPELIKAALVAASGEGGAELERARELLVRRFRDGPQLPRDRERAFAMLVRKGYEPELASDAVRTWAGGACDPQRS